MKQPEASPFASPEPSTCPEKSSPTTCECPPFDLNKNSEAAELPTGHIPPTDAKCNPGTEPADGKVNLTCDEPMSIPMNRALFIEEGEKEIVQEKHEKSSTGQREKNSEITQPRRGSTCSVQPSHGQSPHLRPATP